MSIKKLLMPFIVAVMPLTLHAGPGSAHVYSPSTSSFTPTNRCFASNRDGVRCTDVGFFDGQIGAPWGPAAGEFVCADGCLKWIGVGYTK